MIKIKYKYSEFPLNKAYLKEALSVSTVRLVILGRDPYPNGAEHIPFVKVSWDDLKQGSAGYNLFSSLFGCIPKNDYATPSDCAFALLQFGIVLLNASYHYLEKETISQKRHLGCIDKAFGINLSILERSKLILACGDAHQMLDMVATFDHVVVKVPHPTTQSRNSPNTDKELWDSYWCPHMLNKQFKRDS